jgi:hypothetical protein
MPGRPRDGSGQSMRGGLALQVGIVFLAMAVPALAEEHWIGCNPYPIGECGSEGRASVKLCYIVVDGRYVSVTHDDTLGDRSGVYVFGRSIYRETNEADGLQTLAAFTCAHWVYNLEYREWYGPYNPVGERGDTRLV